ncbi:MAG TPA: histidine phosphatase family protein [Stellaceae bacterium]|nr:histidine phosphatase family protein [Stellaceae bacterium]
MILLVRHGEIEWNLARRIQGWGDSPLTRRGVAQAEAIGRKLRELSESDGLPIVASPLGRARRTAELIQAARADLAPIRFDERLKEISVGAWDGLDRGEIEALAPGIFDGDGRHEWYFRTPDGETYDKFAGRIAAWLADAGDGAMIAVAHGIVTRVLRGLYAGLPREVALSLPVPQDVIWRLADGRIEEIGV